MPNAFCIYTKATRPAMAFLKLYNYAESVI